MGTVCSYSRRGSAPITSRATITQKRRSAARRRQYTSSLSTRCVHLRFVFLCFAHFFCNRDFCIQTWLHLRLIGRHRIVLSEMWKLLKHCLILATSTPMRLLAVGQRLYTSSLSTSDHHFKAAFLYVYRLCNNDSCISRMIALTLTYGGSIVLS